MPCLPVFVSTDFRRRLDLGGYAGGADGASPAKAKGCKLGILHRIWKCDVSDTNFGPCRRALRNGPPVGRHSTSSLGTDPNLELEWNDCTYRCRPSIIPPQPDSFMATDTNQRFLTVLHRTGIFEQEQLDEIRDRLLDPAGNVRGSVLIFVNQEDIRFLQNQKTPIRGGDEVSIIPAFAGG